MSMTKYQIGKNTEYTNYLNAPPNSSAWWRHHCGPVHYLQYLVFCHFNERFSLLIYSNAEVRLQQYWSIGMCQWPLGHVWPLFVGGWKWPHAVFFSTRKQSYCSNTSFVLGLSWRRKKGRRKVGKQDQERWFFFKPAYKNWVFAYICLSHLSLQNRTFSRISTKLLDFKEQPTLTQLSFWGKQQNHLDAVYSTRNIFAPLLATSHNIFGIFTQPLLRLSLAITGLTDLSY